MAWFCSIYKFVFYYFNVFGILSLKSDQNYKLEVSKRWIWSNSLLYPLLKLLAVFLTVFFRNDMIRDDLRIIEGISRFLLLIVSSIYPFAGVVEFACLYVQLWNQKKVLKLIQSCQKIIRENPMKSKLFNDFEKKFIITFLVSVSVVFLIKLIVLIVTYKINLKSILTMVVSSWFESIHLVLLLFLNGFLNYFIFLLRSVNLQLQKSSAKLENILQKFLKVQDLVNEFNDYFGFLLSLTTVYCIFASTVNVRNFV